MKNFLLIYLKGKNLGRIFSKERREKISLGNMGKVMSEEAKNKISESNKGTKNYWFGKKVPKDIKEKRAKAIKAWWDKRRGLLC